MNHLAEDPNALSWNGAYYKTILTSEATRGAMSITDSVVAPGGGPPRHVHAGEDEIFVTLTGRCRFWVDGTEIECGPGETAFVPRGIEHTYLVVGDEPSRHLVILTPGGFEGFFADMAANGYAIPENMAAINESAARFNMTFTGPPLQPAR